MVWVDTSVWVEHFKSADPDLTDLLASDQVCCHPLVVAEIACGTPPGPRHRTLQDLSQLQRGATATVDEVIAFINAEQLYGRGCGYIDLALLASVVITPGSTLWTLDKKLRSLAREFDRSYLDIH